MVERKDNELRGNGLRKERIYDTLDPTKLKPTLFREGVSTLYIHKSLEEALND